MAGPFSFQTAVEIAFGRGVRDRAIAELVDRFQRVLVVHGSRPNSVEWLTSGLSQADIDIVTVSCLQEPQLDQVIATTKLARDSRTEAVIAVGGGSVLDLGKAVAGLAPASGEVMDHLEVVGKGEPLVEPSLFMIAIPTTAGTGAEVTKNAVIGVPEHNRKVSLRSHLLFPDLALTDPELTDGSPLSVTMGSGLDAITQVVEAFVSSKSTALTDAICLDALPRGLSALQTLAQSDVPSARDEMAYTSLVGGLALANAGLGAVHGLAGVIGGRTGAPHGEICAALLPFVMEENIRQSPKGSSSYRKLTLVREEIARALGVPANGSLDALNAWMKSVGLRNLETMGVQAEDLGSIAADAVNASSSRGNPVRLERQDFTRILQREHTACFSR